MRVLAKSVILSALPLLAAVTVLKPSDAEMAKCYPVFRNVAEHSMMALYVSETGQEAPQGRN